KIRFIVEFLFFPNEVGADQRGRGCPEIVGTTEQPLPAHLTAWNHYAREWQTAPNDMDTVSVETVRSNEADGRIRFGERYHFHDAFRKKPVVCHNHFAVLALRGDL